MQKVTVGEQQIQEAKEDRSHGRGSGRAALDPDMEAANCSRVREIQRRKDSCSSR